MTELPYRTPMIDEDLNMGIRPEMSSSALIEQFQWLDGAAIPVWLDGGWGIDALLGTQTRAYHDADLILSVADVPKLLEVLESRGFTIHKGAPPDSFVLADHHGLEDMELLHRRFGVDLPATAAQADLR